MKRFCKILRIFTVPPIMATALLLLLYFVGQNCIADLPHLLWDIFFLSVLPLFSYPLSWILERPLREVANLSRYPLDWEVPDDGILRVLERKMAILLSLVGYVAGTAYAFASGAPFCEKAVFLTYLFSGILTAVLSLCRLKSSGHAAGVAGPVAMLAYAVNPLYLLLLGILAPVYWSSLQLKRHTLPQLLSGTIVPIVSMVVATRIVLFV